jgi:CPA1 family monovalent cation:H+ antiporter
MTRNIEELLGLLAAVALIVWAARAVGLPYPIVLVLGGLGLGYIPGLRDITVAPDVVFLVFLPPLVHAAAYTSSGPRVREQVRTIALLALGLVGVTVGAVAVVAHALIDGMTWPAAFVLGAIVAPTDPVAATAVFRRAGVPERIVAIIEGESLVNDASALVAYRVAIGAVTAGTFSLLDGAVNLVVVSIGGVAVGLVTAYAAAWIRRRLEDPPIEITVTVLTPYLGYIAAEELGVSGILAAVVSGIILGHMSAELFSPGTRLQAYSFWDVLTFLLESTLFILIGLEFPKIADRVDTSIAVGAVAVCATVMVVRLVYLQLVPGVPRRDRLVIGWTGMRGAVSLAAALAVPRLTDSGAPFPARDEIVFVTLLVIGVTLILQGLTLPLVLRGVVDDKQEPGPRQKALARFESVEAALEHLGELSSDSGLPASAIERARELYTQRLSQLAGECRTGVAEDDTDTAAWLRLRLDLLDAERRQLHELRERGEISNEVMREVERDLDLEATRLQSRLAAA